MDEPGSALTSGGEENVEAVKPGSTSNSVTTTPRQLPSVQFNDSGDDLSVPDLPTMPMSPAKSLTRLGIKRQATKTTIALEATQNAFEQGKLFQATENKMEHVWSVVDKDNSNCIGRDEVEHLLRRYFEVSVKIIYKSLKQNPTPIPVEGVFAELLGLESISSDNVDQVMPIFNADPQAFVDLTMKTIDVDGDGMIEKWEFLKEGANFFFGSNQFLGRVYGIRDNDDDIERMDSVDEFGFRKRQSFLNVSLNDIDSVTNAAPIWEQLCSWKTVYSKELEEEAKQHVWNGIPSEFRGKIWMKITGADLKIDSDYYDFLKRKPVHDSSATIIAKDVSRSFPDHFLFAAQHGKGQIALSQVLAAYSIHDIELEYCQGMAFLVATFLMHVSELESFWLLDVLFSSELYNLRHIFLNGFPGFQLLTYEFEVLLAQRLPRVYKLFLDNQIRTDYYLPDWYMSLFTRHILPWDLVLRVWDCFMLFGDVTLHKTSLAILTALEAELLSQEDDIAIVQNLKPLHPHIVSRAGEVVQYMKAIKITEQDRAIIQKMYENEIPVNEAVSAYRRKSGSVSRFVNSVTSKFRRKSSSKTPPAKSQKKRFTIFGWGSNKADSEKSKDEKASEAGSTPDSPLKLEAENFPKNV